MSKRVSTGRSALQLCESSWFPAVSLTLILVKSICSQWSWREKAIHRADDVTGSRWRFLFPPLFSHFSFISLCTLRAKNNNLHTFGGGTDCFSFNMRLTCMCQLSPVRSSASSDTSDTLRLTLGLTTNSYSPSDKRSALTESLVTAKKKSVLQNLVEKKHKMRRSWRLYFSTKELSFTFFSVTVGGQGW